MSTTPSPISVSPRLSRFTTLRRQWIQNILPGATPAVTAGAAAPATGKRRPAALIESLEARVCPSVTVAVGHFTNHGTDDLHIGGVASGQHVVITENTTAHQTTVQVDANGNGLFTDAGDFNQTFNELFFQINVNLKKGSNNTIDYLLSSDMAGANRDVVAKLGAGTNTFNFDAQGHAITDNTLLTFLVKSKTNASEVVNLAFNTIDNSEVDAAVHLGSGTHNVKLNYNGPIQNNSLVQADIQLGDGRHTVAVNLSGSISNSTVQVATLGGDNASGNDHVTYFVGSTVSNDSRVDLSMALRNGDDTGQIFVSQSHFAALDTSRVYFTIDGGEGNDTLNYGSDGTAGTVAVNGLVDALLTGASGNDTIHTNFAASNALALTGTFRLEADGNDGNDTITTVLSNTAASNGSYDVLLFGGKGNDVFALTNNDPTGTGILYDAFGYDLVYGGSGTNVATLVGPDIDTNNIQG